MSKNYNVVLNNNYCTTDSAGNANTNKSYYIDWSAILPDKNFKLTFSFISETNVIKTLIDIPIITIDFLNQGNIDICQPTYQATSSNILGLIFVILSFFYWLSWCSLFIKLILFKLFKDFVLKYFITKILLKLIIFLCYDIFLNFCFLFLC